MFALKGANLPMPFLRTHLFPGGPLNVSSCEVEQDRYDMETIITITNL